MQRDSFFNVFAVAGVQAPVAAEDHVHKVPAVTLDAAVVGGFFDDFLFLHPMSTSEDQDIRRKIIRDQGNRFDLIPGFPDFPPTDLR